MNQAKNPPAHQPSLTFNGGYVEGGWGNHRGADPLQHRRRRLRKTEGGGAVDARWPRYRSMGNCRPRYSVMNLNSNVIPLVCRKPRRGLSMAACRRLSV